MLSSTRTWCNILTTPNTRLSMILLWGCWTHINYQACNYHQQTRILFLVCISSVLYFSRSSQALYSHDHFIFNNFNILVWSSRVEKYLHKPQKNFNKIVLYDTQCSVSDVLSLFNFLKLATMTWSGNLEN